MRNSLQKRAHELLRAALMACQQAGKLHAYLKNSAAAAAVAAAEPSADGWGLETT